jgi:hypothetical protein
LDGEDSLQQLLSKYVDSAWLVCHRYEVDCHSWHVVDPIDMSLRYVTTVAMPNVKTSSQQPIAFIAFPKPILPLKIFATNHYNNLAAYILQQLKQNLVLNRAAP